MSKTVNSFRVPAKQWRKWSEAAREVFNRTHDFIFNNPTLMLHPKSPQPAPAHYKTIAWNAAWIAADAVDDAIPTHVEDIIVSTGRVVSRREVERTVQ